MGATMKLAYYTLVASYIAAACLVFVVGIGLGVTMGTLTGLGVVIFTTTLSAVLIDFALSAHHRDRGATSKVLERKRTYLYH